MKKIILFGDSITAGYEDGVTDFRLNEEIEAIFTDVEVINAGIPGDTSQGALKRVKNHVLKYEPDIVTVFFGANDASKISGLDINSYQENILSLVRLIGPEKVILIGIPYANQKYYKEERPMSHLESFNEVVKEIAQRQKINYINLLAEMTKKEPLELLQGDGLHFSRKGYQLLGKLINNELRKKEVK